MYGKRIKELRLEQKLKQKDLAEKLGISQSSIGMYEREKRQPDVDILKKLAAYFDVSIDYILGVSNKRDSHLTIEDRQDISQTLNELKNQIENSENNFLNYNGIKVTEDDAELLIGTIELIVKQIKKRNK